MSSTSNRNSYHILPVKCLGLKSLHRGPPLTMAHLCLIRTYIMHIMTWCTTEVYYTYWCTCVIIKQTGPKEQQQRLTRLLLVKTHTRLIVWAHMCILPYRALNLDGKSPNCLKKSENRWLSEQVSGRLGLIVRLCERGQL